MFQDFRSIFLLKIELHSEVIWLIFVDRLIHIPYMTGTQLRLRQNNAGTLDPYVLEVISFNFQL